MKKQRFIVPKGITILELIIVIGIMSMVSSLVFVSFYDFRNSSLLNAEAENVVSLISRARANTLAAKNDSIYGVHLESSRVVLFPGNTFTEPNSENAEMVLDPHVEISSVLLNGGGSDIVFSRLDGKTAQHGTITVRIIGATVTRTISVYPSGLIDVE